MKQIKLENLITKRKCLDKRMRFTKELNRWFNEKTRASAVLGIITACLIMFPIIDGKKNSIEVLGQTIEQKTIEVTPTPKPFCTDPINCIRDIGEKQNRSNETIMTMIRIAQKESGMRPDSKNKHSSARGLFQIIAGTWYSNDCVGDKYNYQDNITCAYKILDNQGLSAWEVCTNGSAKCY